MHVMGANACYMLHVGGEEGERALAGNPSFAPMLHTLLPDKPKCWVLRDFALSAGSTPVTHNQTASSVPIIQLLLDFLQIAYMAHVSFIV